jgi:NADH:ubiquinone oxidoreductase subunit F (NADH-binding)
MKLREHLAIHGELPSAHGGGRRVATLIDEVDQAGLRGHGGAAFPTAVKMRAVAAARGSGRSLATRRGAGPIVVVNAVEGEPASAKDRTLLEALPHLVLDGAALAAQAVGADEVIVCTCEQAKSAYDSVAQAIGERTQRRDGSLRWRLASVPARYVAGQESALVNFLNGAAAKPSFTPPMLYERGVRRRPTLVHNPETLAHMALIARHGPEWFRAIGTEAQPGSVLITLGGPVAYPGVYEAEHGSPLSSLIEAAGGLTGEIRAVLMGGYAGTWIDGRQIGMVAIADDELAAYGAQVATGVVLLLGEGSCGLGETLRVARWLAQEAAGQCGPCTHGLAALASTLERSVAGLGDPDDQSRLAHLISIVHGRGACRHPDATVRFVASALEVFAEELADHMRYGPCGACARAGALPIPATRAPRTLLDGRPHVSARPHGRMGRVARTGRDAGAETLIVTPIDRGAP